VLKIKNNAPPLTALLCLTISLALCPNPNTNTTPPQSPGKNSKSPSAKTTDLVRDDSAASPTSEPTVEKMLQNARFKNEVMPILVDIRRCSLANTPATTTSKTILQELIARWKKLVAVADWANKPATMKDNWQTVNKIVGELNEWQRAHPGKPMENIEKQISELLECIAIVECYLFCNLDKNIAQQFTQDHWMEVLGSINRAAKETIVAAKENFLTPATAGIAAIVIVAIIGGSYRYRKRILSTMQAFWKNYRDKGVGKNKKATQETKSTNKDKVFTGNKIIN
jgi:hypothetical protein